MPKGPSDLFVCAAKRLVPGRQAAKPAGQAACTAGLAGLQMDHRPGAPMVSFGGEYEPAGADSRWTKCRRPESGGRRAGRNPISALIYCRRGLLAQRGRGRRACRGRGAARVRVAALARRRQQWPARGWLGAGER